ncbi:hypothetical protein ATANTOWER_011052 [Ataeniobius toweri]|uniref:Uncharacterized protein n=1 Tax=Ataeniobius toweri TaxID=208326 RepID=A0ABU7AG97_9TELE|nr:hypothetical protein [Ataeniobius toweri]
MSSMAHYRPDTKPLIDASLLAHPALSVSCSSSGCQTSSWKAVGGWLKTQFDHDHPHHDGNELSKMPQARVTPYTLFFFCAFLENKSSLGKLDHELIVLKKAADLNKLKQLANVYDGMNR